MFDINIQRVSNCKITVIATTLSDVFAYLFINYNNSDIRERNCGSSKLDFLKKICRADLLIEYKYMCSERIENKLFL